MQPPLQPLLQYSRPQRPKVEMATDQPQAPRNGLRPPGRPLASARNRYQSDGNGSLSGGRLVVALYRRLLSDLVGAETAIESGQIEAAHLKLVHAQEIVDGLDLALDRAVWADADTLGDLYAHLQHELVNANVTKSATLVARCRQIVEPLATTWQEALDSMATTLTGDTAPGLVAP